MRIIWIFAFVLIFYVCSGHAEEDTDDEKGDNNFVSPVECQCSQWEAWSEFSTCSEHCGSGKQGRSRTRHCNQTVILTSHGEIACIQNTTQYRSCNTQDCGCDEVCSPWSEWTNGTCSVFCGGGSQPQTRDRKCQGNQGCPEQDQRTLSCNIEPCSACSCDLWSSWSPYGLCSVTCGQGVQIRNRQRMCRSLSIGQNCTSATIETSTSPCSYGICCDEICLPWSPWMNSSCSVTCDKGSLTRTRTRLCPLQTCEEHISEVDSCKIETCSSTCHDTCTPWGNVTTTPCTVTCGGGTRYHRSTRNCQYSDCITENVMAEVCNVNPCLSCEEACRPWSSWQNTSCSTSCDVGTFSRSRSRYCGIDGCSTQESVENDTCKFNTCKETCDSDCSVWSSWTEGNCSSVCNDGIKTRYRNRTCSYDDCSTDERQDIPCREKTCAATCDQTCSSWSIWQDGTCSTSCDDGIMDRTRTRVCQYEDCSTVDVSSASCRNETCPGTCDAHCSQWAEWHEGNCSTTCNQGVVTRTRFRGCPKLLEDCAKQQEIDSPCYLKTCTDTCDSNCTHWGDWRFGTCSQTCDRGTIIRKRFRTCPEHIIDCEQSDEQPTVCQLRTCPETCDNLCTSWGKWTGVVCSTTCDDGIVAYSRVRTCQFENRDCNKYQNSTAPCNFGTCPETCDSTCTDWSRWVETGACSRSCGSGLQILQRVRSCEKSDCQVLQSTERQCMEGICIDHLKDIRPICESPGKFYPHPTDCSKFFQCAWTIPIELQCPLGTGWVQEKYICDYKWKIPNCH